MKPGLGYRVPGVPRLEQKLITHKRNLLKLQSTICLILHVFFLMKKWSIFVIGVSLISSLSAQPTLIQWSNPSFEDVPGPGRPPLGWYFCGPPEETPPDVQPVEVMEVTTKAKHGKTYAGLVVRDNQTQETLGQALIRPLKAGQCYLLRFYACRSDVFSSYSRLTELPTDYSNPVKLQLWAGNKHCRRKVLLAETEAIQTTSWQIYDLRLRPTSDVNQLFFSATYHENFDFYNGHVLIDHLSPIIAIDCTEGEHSLGLDKPQSSDKRPDTTDLAGKIKDQITGIQWVRNGFSLQQQIIPRIDQGEGWISGNASIYQISDHLKTDPDALLTIAVGPRKNRLLKHHIRLLAAEFMAAGLPPDRCLIRPMKKRDLRRNDWLNANDPEPDILWGISRK